MIGQTASEIAVEHIDDLHADLHAGLPRRHRERETAFRNRDLRPWRALRLAARERPERRFQLAKELRRIEVSRDVRFAEDENVARTLCNFESGLRHGV